MNNFKFIILIFCLAASHLFAGDSAKNESTIELKAWGVPDKTVFGPVGEANIRIVK